jgi:hypothetical protein
MWQTCVVELLAILLCSEQQQQQHDHYQRSR